MSVAYTSEKATRRAVASRLCASFEGLATGVDVWSVRSLKRRSNWEAYETEEMERSPAISLSGAHVASPPVDAAGSGLSTDMSTRGASSAGRWSVAAAGCAREDKRWGAWGA